MGSTKFIEVTFKVVDVKIALGLWRSSRWRGLGKFLFKKVDVIKVFLLLLCRCGRGLVICEEGVGFIEAFEEFVSRHVGSRRWQRQR